MRLALILLGLSAWRAVGEDNTPSSTMQRVLLQDPNAVCLDGSPGAFYFTKGVGSGAAKWLLFHEGKGWCLSPQDCLEHTRSRDGRGGWNACNMSCLPPTLSRRLPEDYPPQGHNVNNSRQISDDAVANPTMFNWNIVWIKTCDGGSWTGARATAELVDGVPVYYRGRTILEAIVSELLQHRELASATDVVIGGGSGGALGVYLNVDHYRTLIDPKHRMKFSALPDGGFFMDLDNVGYHTGMVWIASARGMNATLHPICVASNHNATERCMFAPHMVQYIQAPIFAMQAKYDAWQIRNILGTEDPHAINSFGSNMSTLLQEKLLNRPGNAAFVDSCRHHCEGWNMYRVNGMTEADAFAVWYAGGSAALPRAGRLINNASYPCNSCVCSWNQYFSTVAPPYFARKPNLQSTYV